MGFRLFVHVALPCLMLWTMPHTALAVKRFLAYIPFMAVQIIGWVREMPRLRADGQVHALEAHPVDALVIDGRRIGQRPAENWAYLLRRVRPGDTVATVDLRTMYWPRKGVAPGRGLLAKLRELEGPERAVRIIETSTRLRLWLPGERDEALLGFRERIARASQGGSGGRNRREFSAEQRELVERHWRSLRHATDQIAVDALRAEAVKRGVVGIADLDYPQIVAKHFGASGRSRRKTR